MSYETLKYIFWGLLCVPLLAVGISGFESLLGESLNVEKNSKRMKTKAQLLQEAEEAAEKKARDAEELLRRQKFDEEYRAKHGI